MVPSDAAREHLLRLRQAGFGRRFLAETYGVPVIQLQRIAHGSYRRIHRSTEVEILAMRPGQGEEADGAYVEAAEVWEMAEGLLKRGYSRLYLARATGYLPLRLARRTRKCRASTVFRVTRLLAMIAEGRIRRK